MIATKKGECLLGEEATGAADPGEGYLGQGGAKVKGSAGSSCLQVFASVLASVPHILLDLASGNPDALPAVPPSTSLTPLPAQRIQTFSSPSSHSEPSRGEKGSWQPSVVSYEMMKKSRESSSFSPRVSDQAPRAWTAGWEGVRMRRETFLSRENWLCRGQTLGDSGPGGDSAGLEAAEVLFERVGPRVGGQ